MIRVLFLTLALQHCVHGQQRNIIPILQNERYGPDDLGYYDFRYHSGNEIYHEESGNPLPDQNYAVAGSYSYTSPEGSLISVKYAADDLGFRVDHSGSIDLPAAPPHALRQIEAAKRAFLKKGEIYTNAYSSLPSEGAQPHPGHLPQGLLVSGTDRRTAHEIHLATQKLLSNERRLALERRLAEQRRLALEKKLADERLKALRKRIADDKRLAELKRLNEERLQLELLALRKRAKEENRVEAVRRLLQNERRVAQQLRQQQELRTQNQRKLATQQRLSRDKLLSLEGKLAEERRVQEATLRRRLAALQQQLKPL